MEGFALNENDKIRMSSDVLTGDEIALWKRIGSNHYNYFIEKRSNNGSDIFQYISGSLKDGQEDPFIVIKQDKNFFIIPTAVFKEHFEKAPAGGFRKRKSIRKNKKRRRRTRRTRRV